MTYADLLTTLYRHHSTLFKRWDRLVKDGGIGALVFLPEAYGKSRDLKHVDYDFWTTQEIGEYLERGGMADQTWKDLMWDVDPEKEFLALIIEEAQPEGKRRVHLHRVGEVGVN